MKLKKLFISMITIILSLCMAISVGFACGDEEDPDNPDTPTVDTGFDGKHEITAEEDESKTFIKNGKTEYLLVTPDNPTEREGLAKKEFLWLFKQATGNAIGAVSDANVPAAHSADQKYISLGKTTLLNDVVSKGLMSYDAGVLGSDGVRIKTVDNNVYIVGGSDFGDVYGAYTFMQQMFNYEYYAVDCIDIDTGVKELNLKNFEITDVPDIANRGNATNPSRLYKSVTVTEEEYQMCGWRFREPYGYWYQMQGIPNYEEDSDGSYKVTTKSSVGIHNNLELLNSLVFADEFASWYSTGGDICFTCGRVEGEQREREADLLYKTIALRCLQAFTSMETVNNGTAFRYLIPVTQEDSASACNCAGCKANVDKYGAFSANHIISINKIEEHMETVLNVWKQNPDQVVDLNAARDLLCPNGELDKYDFNVYSAIGAEDIVRQKTYNEFYREDWALTFFAYAYGNVAPTVQDENGTWVPTYPEMNLRDHIVPWVAISNGPLRAHTTPVSENFQAKNQFIGNMESWGNLSPRGYIHWSYATGFADDNIPFDTFQGYTPEFYQMLARTGALHSFSQTCWGSGYLDYSCWGKLFSFLDAKLMWDSNADYNALVNKFFKAMYKDASDLMYQMYVAMKDYNAFQYTMSDGYTLNTGTIKPQFWQLQPLLEWTGLAEQSLEKIDYLKATDPELYEATRGHIISEWVAPTYLIFKFYSNRIPEQKANEMKDMLKEAIDNGFEPLESFLNSIS